MATKQKRRNPTKAERAKRKAKFQQKNKDDANKMNKIRNMYQQQMILKQDIVRRATIVEGILNARPEFATEVDGKLIMNEDAIYLNEDDKVLYWKADNNPIVAGLELYENYSKFSKEFVNEVLEFISTHKNKQNSQTTTDVNLDDFDLVEDETFDEVKVEDENIQPFSK
jgi:hypothetical protein